MSEIGQLPKYALSRSRILRRKFDTKGGAALDDTELLELLLYSEFPACDVSIVAGALMEEFGSFDQVILASPHRVLAVCRTTREPLVGFKLVEEAARRLRCCEDDDRPLFCSTSAAIDYFRSTGEASLTGALRVLYLNIKNRLISEELMPVDKGGTNHPLPRRVAVHALELNASALIIGEYRPSGYLIPDAHVVEIASQVHHTARVLGLVLHDFLLVSATDDLSLKTAGYLARP